MRKILILFTALFITNINAQDILPLKERAAFINKLQKERLNKLLPQLMEKTDIDMCRKKTEELGNESKKRLSSKSGFDKDTPQRRVDCYFRKMIDVTGHGFGKSMIRERDGKDASSDDIIKANPDKEVEISYFETSTLPLF